MDTVMNLRMDAATMPRSRKGRAKTEEIVNPRPRNGNTYAVGAYLETLRLEAGLTREPLVRGILSSMKNQITMSLSTLTQIEGGKNKSVSAATIDAIRIAVNGDPYDISELWRVPIPEDSDEAGIKQSRFAGKQKAIERLQRITLGGMDVIARQHTPKIQQIIDKNYNNAQLIDLYERLANDPQAQAIAKAVLDARNGDGGKS